MKYSLLNLLCCPNCAGEFRLEEKRQNSNCEIEEGNLNCGLCRSEFPVINSIPRFVSNQNYCNNFGFQWNLFRKTQLDSYTNTKISENRFYDETKWKVDEMNNSLMLDAGCGAGRFTEIALSTGATVVAIDFSSAVDGCWQNLGTNKNLHVLQADIYNLPFKANTFDYIYSLGVLQHTYDTKKALFFLIDKLKIGRKLCCDFYKKDWRIYFWPKYWIRPLLKNLSDKTLLNFVKKAVPLLLPISHALSKIPKIGHYLKYAIPVANYKNFLPLSKKQNFEWSILSTFDMYSAKYDHPQNKKTVSQWLKEASLKKIEVVDPGLIIVRAIK